MLPIPFVDFIPKLLRDHLGPGGAAFVAKMDEILTSLSDDAINVDRLVDPVRVPADLLDVFGAMMAAGLNDQDGETEKRAKIAKAVQGHRNRGRWDKDVKPKVDSVAGGNAQIFRAIDEDDAIFTGDGRTPPAFFWATFSTDGIDPDLGESLIGSGLEVEVAGNVYIDVDNPSLTADQVAQIVTDLADSVPAYYKVHIGDVNAGGQFIEYTVIG